MIPLHLARLDNKKHRRLCASEKGWPFLCFFSADWDMAFLGMCTTGRNGISKGVFYTFGIVKIYIHIFLCLYRDADKCVHLESWTDGSWVHGNCV